MNHDFLVAGQLQAVLEGHSQEHLIGHKSVQDESVIFFITFTILTCNTCLQYLHVCRFMHFAIDLTKET